MSLMKKMVLKLNLALKSMRNTNDDDWRTNGYNWGVNNNEEVEKKTNEGIVHQNECPIVKEADSKNNHWQNKASSGEDNGNADIVTENRNKDWCTNTDWGSIEVVSNNEGNDITEVKYQALYDYDTEE